MDNTPEAQDNIAATGTGWIPMDPTVLAWIEERNRESMQWTTWTSPEGHLMRCDRNIHALEALEAVAPAVPVPAPAIEEVRAILSKE